MISRSFPVQLVSWEDAARLARLLAELLKDERGWQPDLVIAIGRGGYVPARVVCDELLTTHLSSIRLEHWGPAASRRENAIVKYPLACSAEGMDLLVIDDVTDTGETLSTAVSYLQQLKPSRIRTGVLHHKISSGFTPDFYAELVKDWRWIIYPWAVHEDISGFLELELSNKPATLPELRGLLQKRYGMPVTSQDLLNAVKDLVRMHRAVKDGDSYRKSAPAPSGENSQKS
ncbi:MAG: phosphoribosyltransferase [Methanoregulaceae archaeon]|nr:phosphoribosyltransferase [Methanoregulaceae archaeon]